MDDHSNRFDLMTVLDAPVVDRSGQRLGEIGELVVNPGEGHIEYAKLWLDSESGPRPEVIVPWSQFHLSADRDCLELNISLGVLRAAANRCKPH